MQTEAQTGVQEVMQDELSAEEERKSVMPEREDWGTVDDITDDFYDRIYEDALDEFYDAVYEDAMEEVYDTYYEGIVKNGKDKVLYGDWLDIRSEFYEKDFDSVMKKIKRIK